MIRSFIFTTQGQIQTKDPAMSAVSAALNDPNLFVWLDLEATKPDEARSILDGVFHFHPLSIEDCIQPSPMPKVEEYVPGPDDKFSPYLFIVMHAVDYQSQGSTFATEELNCFLGKNFLVSYHDVPLQTISSVEDRCRKGSLPTARAPDRMAHILIDALVENYQPALDKLALQISELEQQAVQRPTQETMNRILRLKREVMHLRQIIGPQREVLNRLASGEIKLIRPHLVPYFRDVRDSLTHIAELAQGYADSLTGLLQVYLNLSSNQTGEIIKLLTLITLLTTPLMMIGTWYGMNFKDMPELEWKHGYVVAGTVMLLSTATTWWYFKKKKWF